MPAPRFLRRLGALACVAAACAASAPAAAADPAASSPIEAITRANFVLSDVAAPPEARGGTSVALPDRWWTSRPGSEGSGWYLLEWNRPAGPAGFDAIYLTATTVPAEVFVNGHLIGSTGPLLGPRPGGWQVARLFVIPNGAVVPGVNVIALHVYENSRGQAALGPVLAGPMSALKERESRDLLLHTLGPAVVSATIIVLGLFIIVLWLRRRDATYGLFGFAAILWGVHTGLSLLPAALLPQPHWTIAWTALYMLFVALLCLFCLRFAEVDWRGFRRLIVGFTLAVPVVLYAASAFDVLYRATVVVRFSMILIVLVALTAVARYALAKRDTESILLMIAGAVSAAFGVHDWLVAQSMTDLRPLMLVPYAGLAFLLLVGWILTDRFVRALNEYEALNASLEQRVVEKSEALNEQLEETRAARDAAETANRAKTRFLAAASHDLRQPLHALGLFAARLSDRTRDPEEAALVQRIGTSVASLESLFSALLDISRLEAGAVVSSPRAIALDPLFDRLANDFTPEAIEKRTALRRSAHAPRRPFGSGPAGAHPAQPRRQRAALHEHGWRGRRRAEARGRGVDRGLGQRPRHRARRPRPRVRGVLPDRQSRAGPRPRDGPRTGDRAAPGDAARPRSHAGVGGRPRFGVPRARARRAAGRRRARAARERGFPDPLAGRRVLVIDDDEPVREGMRQTLVAWGCVPIMASDAAEAVARCRTQAPDAMVVDFRLPDDRDGLDAIATVRAALARAIPALVVSGESSSEQITRVRNAGFTLLHKPVAPAKFRAALAFALS